MDISNVVVLFIAGEDVPDDERKRREAYMVKLVDSAGLKVIQLVEQGRGQEVLDHIDRYFHIKETPIPSYSVDEQTAANIVELLAPMWALHSVKIIAYEECAPFRAYQSVFGTEAAFKEIIATRNALEQVESILSVFTEGKPELDKHAFIAFKVDIRTKELAPIYDHGRAMAYAQQVAVAWATSPLKSAQQGSTAREHSKGAQQGST